MNTAVMINIFFRDPRNINMSNPNEKQPHGRKKKSCHYVCVCVGGREMLTRSIFSFFICSKETSAMGKDETEQEDQIKKKSTSTSVSWDRKVSFNTPENIPFTGLSKGHERQKERNQKTSICVLFFEDSLSLITTLLH